MSKREPTEREFLEQQRANERHRIGTGGVDPTWVYCDECGSEDGHSKEEGICIDCPE